MKRYKIYLAGPSVFRRDAYEFGQELVRICARHGFEGVYPIGDPGELKLDEGDRVGNARRIFNLDMEKLIEADAVIADMAPFRGPGMDGGTAFEMGAAYMAGKPVVGYGPSLTYRDKTESWISGVAPDWKPSPDPATGLIFDHDDLAIDDFGGVENLMMDQCLKAYVPSFEDALQAMRWVFDQIERDREALISELEAKAGAHILTNEVDIPEDFGRELPGVSGRVL